MTDYLELLLAAEEDEEEPVIEWEEPAPLSVERGGQRERPSGRRKETAVAEGLDGQGAAQERKKKTGDPAKTEDGMAGTVDRLLRSGPREWDQAVKGKRTALLEDPLAEAETGTRLYQRVRRLRDQTRAVRQESGGTARTLEIRREAGEGLTLEGLDRAVQRDARRYDGGFNLY